MKKMFLLLVLSLFICGNLFAADFSLSAGAGGLLGAFFTRYESSSSSGDMSMTQKVDQLNYGALVFFDASYAELSVLIQSGSNSYDEVMVRDDDDGPDFVARTGDGWETMLGFCLLGKYPFTLTKKLTLFPLLGIEYQIALSEKRRVNQGIIYDRTNGIYEKDANGNSFDISTWNAFWIHVGVGTDIALAKSFFIRSELLYSFRLMTAYESDGLEQMKSMLNDNDPKLSGLTSGPSLRLCAGYRFFKL